MIRDLAAALDAWEHDTDVDIVLLDGAGDRGLCAGGDVRGLYEQIIGGRARGHRRLLPRRVRPERAHRRVPQADRRDRRRHHDGRRHRPRRSRRDPRSSPSGRSSRCPRPASASPPTSAAPGCSRRAPGASANTSALTGASMDASDAIYAGFADHFVPVGAPRCAARRARDPRRSRRARPSSCCCSTRRPQPSRLDAARAWIDDAFAADTVAEIVERLRARPEPEAAATADVLGELAPTALAVTLEAVRRARELPDLRAALAQEYGLVLWFATTPARPRGGHPRAGRRQGPLARAGSRRRSPTWHRMPRHPLSRTNRRHRSGADGSDDRGRRGAARGAATRSESRSTGSSSSSPASPRSGSPT